MVTAAVMLAHRLFRPYNCLLPTLAYSLPAPNIKSVHASVSIQLAMHGVVLFCFLPCAVSPQSATNVNHEYTWKAKSRSGSLGISRLLWNLNVRYHVHKGPPLSPFLSQMNAVRTLRTYLYNIYFNIMLSSTFGLFPSVYRQKLYMHFSISHPYYMSLTSYPPMFIYPDSIRWIVAPRYASFPSLLLCWRFLIFPSVFDS